MEGRSPFIRWSALAGSLFPPTSFLLGPEAKEERERGTFLRGTADWSGAVARSNEVSPCHHCSGILSHGERHLRRSCWIAWDLQSQVLLCDGCPSAENSVLDASSTVGMVARHSYECSLRAQEKYALLLCVLPWNVVPEEDPLAFALKVELHRLAWILLDGLACSFKALKRLQTRTLYAAHNELAISYPQEWSHINVRTKRKLFPPHLKCPKDKGEEEEESVRGKSLFFNFSTFSWIALRTCG